MSRALRLSAIASTAIGAVAIALRVVDPYGLPGPSVSALVPILWGLGALVVLGLVHAWAPTLGWAAAIVASSAGALAVVGFSDEVRLRTGVDPGPWLGLAVVAAVLLPPVVAAAYAVSGRQRRSGVLVAAWLVVGVLTVALAARAAARSLGGEMDTSVPEWLWLGVIALLSAIGLVRDLGPAFGRTRDRLAAGEVDGSGARAALPALRVFVDEVVPGRAAGRAEAVETERGRLAADLHAEVLPSLRRALAEAEAGGTVERLAADLRTAVDEVEALLVARRSIVLDEMGLLAGVEWLAERVEDRSTVRVEIAVEGTSGDGNAGARPPRDVERAAFRVAQLALDNVIRHAPGSHAQVTVAVQATAVRLRIEDDGEGPAVDEPAAARSGRRGIADMRAEARACGAGIEIGRAEVRGTVVTFRWPETAR